MSDELKPHIIAPPPEELPKFVAVGDKKHLGKRRKTRGEKRAEKISAAAGGASAGDGAGAPIGAGPEAGGDAGAQVVATKRPVLRRLFKTFVWLMGFAGLVGAGILYILDKPIDAPEWMRVEAEARIEQHLNGLQLDFGTIELVVNRGWRPEVSFRNVTLTYEDGSPAAALDNAQVALAMRPLLRGQLRPKSLTLSGLFATLQRGSGGAMALSLSDGSTPFREASNFPQLMDSWDRQLELPILSALTQVDIQAVTLRYEDLRADRAWTLDGGTIAMSRNGERVHLTSGFSVLSGRDYASTLEGSYESDIGSPAAVFSATVDQVPSEDIATQSAAFGWLDVLRAPISGAMSGSVDDEGRLLPLTASLEIGAGLIQPSEELKSFPLSSARSDFTFDPKKQELEFSDLSVSSAWVTGHMEGRAELVGVRDGKLTDLVGQLRFRDLNLNPMRLYPDDLELTGVSADFRMELSPFRLRLGEMLVQKQDTNVRLSGALWGGEAGWNYDLAASSPSLGVDLVKTLWPPSAPPKPRKWFIDNVHAGQILDAEVALRGREGHKPFVSLELGFEDGEVEYLKHYPVLQRAAGRLSIYGNRLVATATEGWVAADQGGEVNAAGTSFIIPDMSIKDGNGLGIVRAQVDGPVEAAFSLLNRAPLQIMDKANLPVALATGHVAATATVSTPMHDHLDVADVTYHYSGVVQNMRTDVLVPGHVLEAEQLQLTGDQTQIELAGAGAISGIPVQATWHLDLNSEVAQTGIVEGTVELSEAAAEALDLGFPKGAIGGKGVAQFNLEMPPSAPPRLSVSSDLRGVTMYIAEVGWRKAAKATGALSFQMELNDVPVVEDFSLEAPGLKAKGRIVPRPEGGLDRAIFSSLSVGNWLRGAVTLTGRGAATPAITMTSGSVDLRIAPFSSAGASDGSDSGGGTPITLALDRLQITDSIAMSPFEGRFSTRGGFNGDFTGLLNGRAPINGVVVPQSGGMAMRAHSKDAGNVIRSADVLDETFGGDFEMTLIPSKTAGEYIGQVKITNMRVKRAPAIAALVNALSLIGLVDELAGKGILFTRVEGDFRLGPRYLDIKNSSAVGPSIGVSLDGLFDLETGGLNMRGVVSPIYLLNAIGSVLTRKGEGLFGVSFTLKGTSDDPKVGIKPLSALAPGFLREFFRGKAPSKPGAEVKKRKTAKEMAEERRKRREAR